jgi:hypothetical protein
MAYASVVIVTILQACFLEWDMHVCAMEKPSKKLTLPCCLWQKNDFQCSLRNISTEIKILKQRRSILYTAAYRITFGCSPVKSHGAHIFVLINVRIKISNQRSSARD